MQDCLKRELDFQTSRSSGPGGQHVNRTETRVELRWNLADSACLTHSQKELLSERLGSRLTGSGELILACERHRSQYRNREEVTSRFLELIERHLKPKRKRRPTKPTKASVENRLRQKKDRSALKKTRKKRPGEDH